MKNLLIASTFAIAAYSSAQGGNVSPWSGSMYFDLRTQKTNAVVLNRVRDLTINGKPTRYSLYGFAGTSVDGEGKAVGGLAFGREWKIIDQFSAFAGIGVSFSGGAPLSGGFLIGGMLKF